MITMLMQFIEDDHARLKDRIGIGRDTNYAVS